MTTVQNTRRLGEWQPTQCPFLIQYSPGVLSRIRQAVEDGLHTLRGGVEVGGVLFGTHEKDRVRILSFRPMECEHLYGPSFVLSEQDREKLTGLLEDARRSPALQGLEPVGWYHSHTRSEIQLSDTDLDTYQRFFGGSRQIALVLRPATGVHTRAGFFFRELDGGVHSSSTYLEFDAPVTPKLGEAARTPPPAPAPPEPPRARTAPEPPRARPAADPPIEGRMSLTKWPLTNPPGAAVPPPPAKRLSRTTPPTIAYTAPTTPVSRAPYAPPERSAPLAAAAPGYAPAPVARRVPPVPPPPQQAPPEPPAATGEAVEAVEAVEAAEVVEVPEAVEAADVAETAPPPAETPSQTFPVREPLLPGDLPQAIGMEEEAPPRQRKKRIWPWVAAAALLVAGVGAFLLSDRSTPPPVTAVHDAPLHLRATESDGVLRIAWDPSALAGREVRGGTLVIDDGAQNPRPALSARETQAGYFLFIRTSPEVHIHLSVQVAPDGLMEDSTTFQAPLASPLAASVVPPAPAVKDSVPAALPAATLASPAPVLPAREEPKKAEPPAVAPLTAAQMAAAERLAAQTVHPPVYVPPPPKPAPAAAAPKLDQPINIPSRVTAAPPLALAQTPLAVPAPQPPPAMVSKPTAPPANAPPPAPALPPSLSGHWTHAASAPTGSPFPPQSASLTLSESGGTLYGSFTGQYRVPKGQKISPQVEFTFEGAEQGGALRFPFTTPNGLKGEVEVIRLPGKANTLELVWHSSRDNLTFDDVFSRSQ